MQLKLYEGKNNWLQNKLHELRENTISLQMPQATRRIQEIITRHDGG